MATVDCVVCTSLKFPNRFTDSLERPFPIERWQSSRNAGCFDCGIILGAVHEYDSSWVAQEMPSGQIQLSQDVGVVSVRLLSAPDDSQPEIFQIFQDQGELS